MLLLLQQHEHTQLPLALAQTTSPGPCSADVQQLLRCLWTPGMVQRLNWLLPH